MNVSRSRILILLLALLTLTATAFFSHAALPPQPGEKAPDWILTNGAGKSVSLYRDAEAAQVVMIFWATWCPFCADLIPKLETLSSDLNDKTIKFYGLNVWEDADPKQYLQTKAPSFTLLLKAESVAQRYGVVGTPGVFVLDADKTITYIRQRGADSDEVIAFVKAALGR